MSGEVEPKFALMVSLILMNLSAIALFFYTTPTPKELDGRDNVQAELVMAGDAENRFGTVKRPSHNEVGVLDEAQFTAQKKSRGGSRNRASYGSSQARSGRVGEDAKRKSTAETIAGIKDVALGDTLKNIVGKSKSGIKLFFEGLKGYKREAVRERIDNMLCIKKSKSVGGVPDHAADENFVREPAMGSTKLDPLSTARTEDPGQVQEPTPSWVWGPWENGSSSNQDIALPTEMVMDILSRTQERTNELINVFSKRVIPAIERMNEKVTQAIRLEKNLDSYTSTLIHAINSVACSKTHDGINPSTGRGNAKPRTSLVRKLKQTKAFSSDISLMRDSRIHDYVGSFSKGERSSTNKRPVFKTLAVRCLPKRHKRTTKRSSKSKRCEAEMVQVMRSASVQHSEIHSSKATYQEPHGALEQASHTEPTNPMILQKGMVEATAGGAFKREELWKQRTIGIDEILALKSCVEHSSDPTGHSDTRSNPFPFPSYLDSSVSFTSGMASRSQFILDSPEIVSHGYGSFDPIPVANTSAKKSTENIKEHPSLHKADEQQQLDALVSDISVVCESRFNGYESSLGEKESSTFAANSATGREEVEQNGSQQTNQADFSAVIRQHGGSNAMPGTGTTVELVRAFVQLDRQQKEVAMENICLLVLRMFEAWSESQRPLTPLGLCRLSMNSFPGTEDLSIQNSRPRTAIFRSTRIDSSKETKFLVSRTDTQAESSREHEVNIEKPPEGVQTSVDISRALVNNIIESAEMEVAERSLMGVKTNNLRNRPVKEESLPSSFDVTATTPNHQSGFGDIKKNTALEDEQGAVSLRAKSHESVMKASKESSAVTFYTGQPESSEDAFFECASTFSNGTYGSLEIEDSSKVFMEKIQEEGTIVQKSSPIIAELAPVKCESTVESWLTQSGSKVRIDGVINSEEFLASECSSLNMSGGTDEDMYQFSSQDLTTDESVIEACSNEERPKKKKKKWAVKLLNKILKKKSKPSTLNIASSSATPESISDVREPAADNNFTVGEEGGTI